eukprot:m.19044 g.19044  ORF g.19044 m.19044 type:complete len:176 (-) comp6473_c0_seq1:104-631(-)
MGALKENLATFGALLFGLFIATKFTLGYMEIGAMLMIAIVVYVVLMPSYQWYDASKAEIATFAKLPPTVTAYKRIPASGVFTAETIPKGLLTRHNTKPEVFGEINVTKGELLFELLEGTYERVLLSPSKKGIVLPQQWHKVTPRKKDTEMFIRFYAEDGAPYGNDSEDKNKKSFG